MNNKSMIATIVLATSLLVWGISSHGQKLIDFGGEASFAPQEARPGDPNFFAVGLYHQLSKQKDNLFFSPLSISSVFAMAQLGAHPDTAQEVATVFNFPASTDALLSHYSGLVESLNTSGKIFSVRLANALWVDKDFELAKSFVDPVRQSFQSSVQNLDFSDAEGSASIINKWVSEKTVNKITQLVEASDLESGVGLVITNAIYFFGKWQNTFDGHTSPEPFHMMDGSSHDVPMMRIDGSSHKNVKYFENWSLQVLSLPYLETDISMIIFLPKSKDGLPALEKKLSSNKLDEWISELKDSEVIIALPKFRVDQSFRLAPTLNSMGVKKAFSPHAGYTGISARSLYISNVIHKSYISVTEEGTEAAAVTAAIGLFTGANMKKAAPPRFEADHPFLYVIYDNRTKTILFMGRIMDPTGS